MFTIFSKTKDQLVRLKIKKDKDEEKMQLMIYNRESES